MPVAETPNSNTPERFRANSSITEVRTKTKPGD